MISILVPAYNEEGFIGDSLRHLLKSDDPAGMEADHPVEVIVVPNGCQDATAAEARALAPDFAARGWRFRIIELAEGSKTAALNAGIAAAANPNLVFMDADIHVSPGLIAALARAVDRPAPTYASGQFRIRRARSYVSRLYARFWARLPFMARGVPGCGIAAVNSAGRARWDEIPEVISDDIFIRSHFAAEEMVRVPDAFSWPIAEGFGALVRVRRRQNRGLAELGEKRPDLVRNAGQTAPGAAQKVGLMLRDPLGFAIYTAVALTVKTPLWQPRGRWDRDRGV
ncbi:glycosyltransferase family 2 protein [Antarcticimicrobium luteum]|uniref:Glycosyltransferase n=1 Tax=Antarcticimicrobium luteum TaxID=2547397 RepID=A0A4R5V415_9RHOB|nr:glycosyltransferase [Antarcticimicrobium luteum]TDK46265.1 glycosyltransferase [Antarcticimicrobium luteum]